MSAPAYIKTKSTADAISGISCNSKNIQGFKVDSCKFSEIFRRLSKNWLAVRV